MRLLSLKLLLSLFLFLTFTHPIFAQEQYYFQEEFNAQRTPNELDPNKWIVYPNKRTTPNSTGCMFDTIREENGIAFFHQCSSTDQFPYIVSKTNPIPNSDFISTIRFHFTGIGALPSGIKFVDKAPGNGAGQTELFSVGFEESTNNNQDFRIEYKDGVVFTKDDDSNYYIFTLQKQGDIYKLSLNNQLVFTSPPTKERIGALYIGSPAVIPGFNWTDLRVDYIHVTQTGPVESTPPEPFLDLPWDYGNTHFNQVVFDPNAWFDHNGPLQNYNSDTLGVLKFTGKFENDFYKSHSGYDYGARQGVDCTTLVKASADGNATFKHKSNSGGAGNMIIIDHENGYQTWYEHLEEATPGSKLIVKEEGMAPVPVNKGDVLGQVGLTGKTTGCHIHLSVFKDINNNGVFNDDGLLGLLDPLGWEGDYTDPWEEYTIGDKHGAKSYKLFTGLTPPSTQQIPTSGGTISKEEVTVSIPANSADESLNYEVELGPFESFSEIIKSIVPSVFLSANTLQGNPVSTFNNPLTLTYDYSEADLSNSDEDSISFYFFNEVSNLWEKLPSLVNKNNKTISTETTHFSQYAVMAEQLDISPPVTTVQLTGSTGTDGWYKSEVIAVLSAEDNGSGVSYGVYSLNGEDWEEYIEPIHFSTEGGNKLYFLSHDNAGNTEEVKSVEFSIDKTIPEAKVFIDLDKMDLAVLGIDDNPVVTASSPNLVTKKKDDGVYTITDLAGNSLMLDVRDRDKDKKDRFRIHSLQYNSETPIILDKNFFNVDFSGKKENLNIREQNFELKGETKIRIQYDHKKNQSKIITKDAGSEKVKDVRNGLTTLILQTNKGALEYVY